MILHRLKAPPPHRSTSPPSSRQILFGAPNKAIGSSHNSEEQPLKTQEEPKKEKKTFRGLFRVKNIKIRFLGQYNNTGFEYGCTEVLFFNIPCTMLKYWARVGRIGTSILEYDPYSFEYCLPKVSKYLLVKRHLSEGQSHVLPHLRGLLPLVGTMQLLPHPPLPLLKNSKSSDFYAPLTSFDWNHFNPNRIATSNIDTTI
ncbi:hypothetical protein Fmac_021236 [Flemingia macrophylla]|uniref:Uncharacterized protein n=1 Tax=Flemingia macrophylla TaxID=520843 RepID=A0ABD1LWC5_9FABA